MYIATIRCDQSSSCGPISTGTPSISGDDRDRQRCGEGGQQVDRPSGRKGIDQRVRQRLDARPEPLDLTRDEGAVDQRAQPRVDRRLELEQRVGLDRVEILEMRAVAPMPRLSGMPPGSAGRSAGRAAAG